MYIHCKFVVLNRYIYKITYDNPVGLQYKNKINKLNKLDLKIKLEDLMQKSMALGGQLWQLS